MTFIHLTTYIYVYEQGKQQNKAMNECLAELSTTREALKRCKSQVHIIFSF